MKRFSEALAESGGTPRIPLPLLLATSTMGLAIALVLLISTLPGIGAEAPGPALAEATAAAIALAETRVATATARPTRTAMPTPTSTPSLTSTNTRLPSPTPTATRTATPRPTATATESPITLLSPLRTLRENGGASGYQTIEVSGLSAGGNVLRLHGAVRLPRDRYADQYWEVQWASSTVIDDIGLSAIDKRIQWYAVDDARHTEDAYEIIVQWQLPTDARCRFWVRIVAVAGERSEQWYGQFDASDLGANCE